MAPGQTPENNFYSDARANNTLYDSYDSITKPVCSWHNDMWLHFCPRLRFNGSRGAIRKTNINCLFNMHIWNASFDNIIVICLTRRWLKSFVSEIYSFLIERQNSHSCFHKICCVTMRLCLAWINDSRLFDQRIMSLLKCCSRKWCMTKHINAWATEVKYKSCNCNCNCIVLVKE